MQPKIRKRYKVLTIHQVFPCIDLLYREPICTETLLSHEKKKKDYYLAIKLFKMTNIYQINNYISKILTVIKNSFRCG